MLRIALENFDSIRVDRISQPPCFARSTGSITSATDASPKMKWLSRSRQFMCPVVISGTTTSARFDLPSCTASLARLTAKVADEQPTAMS